MTRIDRYVLRQFIITACASLCAFIVLFVVVDMMENLDDFLDKQAPLHIVVTYYLYFMPEIIKLIIPVAMLLSALFTTGRLSNHNELPAMKSTGLSLYRFMAPLLIFALLVSGASIYFTGWIGPYANKKKFEIGRVYFQKNIEYVAKSNIYIQDSPTRILSIGFYDDQKPSAQQISIQDFDPHDLTKVVARYDANEMRWDAATQSWMLINGYHRLFRDSSEWYNRFASLSMSSLNFSPEDIKKKQQKPDEMDYNDLHQFIHNQQRAGQDVSRWLVDFYGKIAFPFSSVIVVLFGVPFSSVKRRSGLGVEFGIALGVCFLYMVLLKISQAFGYNGDLDPLLTAWMANIFFLIAGIYNLIRVPK
jgi:lipopolysaccharide export system permease protein